MSVVREIEGGSLSFFCPGCREHHVIRVREGAHPRWPVWTWNGDTERPTLSPSILVKSGHYVESHRPGVDTCWCDYKREHPEDNVSFSCYVCHSFVRDGRIEFLGDCTHSLAGQTVPLPALEEQ